MGKAIYIYLNDEDLLEIVNLLEAKKVSIYNEEKLETNHIQAVSNGLRWFYIGSSDHFNIKFIPCFYSAKYLQCASFCLISKDDVFCRKIFTFIKKHITRNYKLSGDKSYYIGPGIYREWLNRKIILPVFFECSKFSVNEDDIPYLFDEILSEGYKIKTNNVRIRDIDVIDFKAESFVVFNQSYSPIVNIIGKNIIRYEYGLDCIFVNRKNHQYVFCLDARIVFDQNSTLPSLFEKIKKRYGTKT